MSRLRQRFDELVAEGRAERFGEQSFLAVHTLGSGARLGLLDDLGWALAEGAELTKFEPATARAFVEVLEQARADFEAELAGSASALALGGDEVVASFPAIELLRALLPSGSSHFTRLSLAWLWPSELRALRSEIDAAADDGRLIEPVRALARRLVVPKRG